MNPSYLLVLLGVAMVSYSGPLVKLGLQYGANPVSIAMMRMVLSALILLPIMCWKRKGQSEAPIVTLKRMTRKQWLWSVAASAFLALHYLTWMTSLDATSTFASVALVCTQPLFVAVFSYFLFKEKIPGRAVPGAVLALLGAATIALAGLAGQDASAAAEAASDEALMSNLLALLGAMLMAGNWLTGRETRRTLSAEVYTPMLYAATALFLALTLPAAGGFVMPVSALPWMAGLVIGSTLLGNAIFNYTLDKVSATIISFALLGEPVGAMVFSIFLFDEIPTPLVAVGGLLTIAGLAYYLARSGPSQKQD